MMQARSLKALLLVANRHGLCCVALLAWIRHQGWVVAQIQDLTDEQCRTIAVAIRERFGG